MATYKVIQDIEAEDHILGPLTLRQFIFALISIFFFYISFVLFSKGVAFLIILFLPPALFFGFFAIPFGRDQPTEVWALAKLRFFLKPRKRIWNQSGIKELVTITVPKKIERRLTDGLSQYEVESRLNTLANTLDSRGWAIKNSGGPGLSFVSPQTDSDRLVEIDSAAQVVDESANTSDVLDDVSSPLAQHFSQMIDESSRSKREELINQMNSPTPEPPLNNSQWFMPQTGSDPSIDSGSDSKPTSEPVNIYAADVEPKSASSEDTEIMSQIKAHQQALRSASSNLRVLQRADDTKPLSTQPVVNSDDSSSLPADPTLTGQPDPAILSLATSDDLSVQAIAHEAKRAKGDDLNQDEVVISLH